MQEVRPCLRSRSFLTLPLPGAQLGIDTGQGSPLVCSHGLIWCPPAYRNRIGSMVPSVANIWRIRLSGSLWAPEVAADTDALFAIQRIESWVRYHQPVLPLARTSLERVWALADELCAIAEQPRAPEHRMLLKAGALQLLGILVRDPTLGPALDAEGLTGQARRARERIHPALTILGNSRDVRGVDLTVHSLAHCCGLRPSRFHQLFKDATGMTPQVYLTRLRVAQACELLAGGDLPISDVATTCGFSGASRFNEAFKGVMQMTPRDYRLQALSSGDHGN